MNFSKIHYFLSLLITAFIFYPINGLVCINSGLYSKLDLFGWNLRRVTSNNPIILEEVLNNDDPVVIFNLEISLLNRIAL
jgi:hypothetical protein